MKYHWKTQALPLQTFKKHSSAHPDLSCHGTEKHLYCAIISRVTWAMGLPESKFKEHTPTQGLHSSVPGLALDTNKFLVIRARLEALSE